MSSHEGRSIHDNEGISCLSVSLHCDAQECESTSEESVLMPGHAFNVRSRESWSSLVNVVFWPHSDRERQSRPPTSVTLDFRLFRDLQCVVDVDAEVPDSAF
jgi:hypothetical protein